MLPAYGRPGARVPLPSCGVPSHVGRQARPPSDAIAFTCPLVPCAVWSLGVPVNDVGELEAGRARCDRSADVGRAARVTLYDIVSLPKA
ncbi:hypothetical protein PsYK624_052250 [Phanerochaete sordida]|uniref:Uncharacterized protein n=1 Tax=Phanerochaete sordida TaxID=48140 RepID=A0A9P3G6J0_9APHY|nr:hypothetical protein PsYK624_052250 [Phanerochaete sordida]